MGFNVDTTLKPSNTMVLP